MSELIRNPLRHLLRNKLRIRTICLMCKKPKTRKLSSSRKNKSWALMARLQTLNSLIRGRIKRVRCCPCFNRTTILWRKDFWVIEHSQRKDMLKNSLQSMWANLLLVKLAFHSLMIQILQVWKSTKVKRLILKRASRKLYRSIEASGDLRERRCQSFKPNKIKFRILTRIVQLEQNLLKYIYISKNAF